MQIVAPQVIVPDSSHWANWIDAALSKSNANHQAALALHNRLISAGRIPLMTWHHLEELLSIEDEAWACRRVGFIQALPFVAFVRFPHHAPHSGSIVDVLSAEVTAVLEGATTLSGVRDSARKLMICTGSGEQIIGKEAWVWSVVRHEFLSRNQDAKMIASTRRMSLFDDSRTIGEIAKGSIRPGEEQASRFTSLRVEVLEHIRHRGDKEISDPNAVASEFMKLVESLEVPEGIDVRSLVELALVSQGLDRDEIRDDAVLADLNDLAIFRARLKVIADNIDVPFIKLKRIDMKILPSWQTQNVLELYGQDRQRRAGSDLTDGILAALAPYVDELFVDKRTAEDFRRLRNKTEEVTRMFGKIRKSPDFNDLARDSET